MYSVTKLWILNIFNIVIQVNVAFINYVYTCKSKGNNLGDYNLPRLNMSNHNNYTVKFKEQSKNEGQPFVNSKTSLRTGQSSVCIEASLYYHGLLCVQGYTILRLDCTLKSQC